MEFLLRIHRKDGIEDFPLKKSITYIGRVSKNDIILKDDHVSKKHAKLNISIGLLEICDLGSTNGIKVNGTVVDHKFLRHNDRVQIGNTEFIVNVQDNDKDDEAYELDKTTCFTKPTGGTDAFDLDTLQSELPSVDMIIGKNRDVMKIFESVKKLKDTNSTVLILGESGTGKGVLARAIHEQSNRRKNPFVNANCSIFSQSLLESELFGHEKGAFTGADRLKKGRFELANGGTIFLDEIGEFDKSLQAKLLRILQEKTFERVGGTETLITDVRTIAATNTDLERAIELNSFRKDLYYRLKVVVFKLPPLRERREDIPTLARFFLEKYNNKLKIEGRQLNKLAHKFDDECMNVLQNYNYPGNIRELENIIERAVVLAEDDVISKNDLPDEIQYEKYKSNIQVNKPDKILSIFDMEKETISKILFECSWNQSKASRLLGISRDQLRYRIKKYNISMPSG